MPFRTCRFARAASRVPLQDMANHDFAPTTNFTYEDPGVFRLRALQDLAAGEEVSCCEFENSACPSGNPEED